MVFWAGNFIVVKGAIGILPPVGFTFLRYLLASLTLLGLLRWRTGSIRPPGRDFVPIAILGIVGFGCYQILWPVALQSIPAGDSALLIATTPVITAMLAAATRADAPNVVKLTGAMVSFVGVGMVIAAGQGLDLGVSLVGGLLATTACLAITYYGAIAAYRLGLDPDNHGIPLVTSSMDLIGAIALIFAILLLHVA